MSARRVVVTGMAGITAAGSGWPEVEAFLRAGTNATRVMDEWSQYVDLAARLAAPVDGFAPPAHWTRKQLRSMGRVSQLAVRAAELALAQSGLAGDAEVHSGAMGVACGSSISSVDALRGFAEFLMNGQSARLDANSYLRLMPHTTVANMGTFFGLKGRVIPTSSACTSGSQAIGFAYESIRAGQQTMMLAGGSEEMSPTQAMAFDLVYAASRTNDAPKTVPRPYDLNRDGLVVGEGAAVLVLEEREHAIARGAHVHAELVGFATNSDGVHLTRPEQSTMQRVMQMALDDAALPPTALGYVNGHGTATEHGDIAETQATSALFGSRMPISSQKSYLGHTLGACGAIEAWFTIEMMNRQWFAPTINLHELDPRCGELDYIRGHGRELAIEYAMSNNFAFGGVNTSLVFRRPS